MPVYQTSEQLDSVLKQLFNKIKENKSAVQTVTSSRMVIRLSMSNPTAEVTINGRHNPVEMTFGPSQVRPDLDVSLPADTLHLILTGEMPLRKALASGGMKVKGPIWKTFALQEILHQGQAVYPQIIKPGS
jgi:putative sterol carrier protein